MLTIHIMQVAVCVCGGGGGGGEGFTDNNLHESYIVIFVQCASGIAVNMWVFRWICDVWRDYYDSVHCHVKTS